MSPRDCYSFTHATTPSFLRFGASKHIAAIHADGSLLGPASMSVPGFPFSPAHPGETVVLEPTDMRVAVAARARALQQELGLSARRKRPAARA